MSMLSLVGTTALSLTLLLGVLITFYRMEEFNCRRWNDREGLAEAQRARKYLTIALVFVLLAGFSLVWAFYQVEQIEIPVAPSVTQ